MYQVLLSLLVVLAFQHCSMPISAFRVEFQAFDVMPTEQILHLQEPYPFLSLTQDSNQVESLADVVLTQEEVWEEDSVVGNMSRTCSSIMHLLATEGGNFTHCLIHHARPFRVCEKCVTHYTRFTHLYKSLLGDASCKKVLLMADRMQVITNVYGSISYIWSFADCALCFDSIEENATTRQVTYNFTAETVYFQELEANVSQCFKNYSHTIDARDNSSEVCHACKNIYKQMNKYFFQLNKDTGGNICMDVVDMMNYTRLVWSTEFNCSRPLVDASVVITISVVVVIVTVLLYSVSKLVAKIRMPQIFKQKRMKTCRRRYGSVSQIEGTGESPYYAVASIQAEGHHRRLHRSNYDGNA